MDASGGAQGQHGPDPTPSDARTEGSSRNAGWGIWPSVCHELRVGVRVVDGDSVAICP